MKWLLVLIVVAFVAGWGLRGSFGLSPTSNGVGFTGNVHVTHKSPTVGGQP